MEKVVMIAKKIYLNFYKKYKNDFFVGNSI